MRWKAFPQSGKHEDCLDRFCTSKSQGHFDYHVDNASRAAAHNIRKQILQASKRLVTNPELEPIEPNLDILGLQHRYLLVGHYKMIYRLAGRQIIINDLFDTRRKPANMMNEGRDD